MMSQSFRGMPQDYIDAAKLDHARLDQLVLKIVAPLNKRHDRDRRPVHLYRRLGQFPLAADRITDIDKMPLSVLLATFSKQYGAYAGPVMAGAVLQTLPLVILFVLFRRSFLAGMSLTLK